MTVLKPRLIRYEESYDELPDSSKNTGWLKLKDMTVGENLRLSAGFNYREMIESVKNDASPGINDTYWLTRMAIHGDLKWKKKYRVFLQLGRSVVQGKRPPIRPIDEDQLYVLNGFGEMSFGNHKHSVVRFGRQEMFLGTGRLIAPREGPNVRNSFDGIVLQSNYRTIKSNIFFTTVVQNGREVLDDQWFHSNARLWGSYHTISFSKSGLDVYYLGYQNRDASFISASEKGKEIRHSLGTRFFGSLSKSLTCDAEVVYQSGRFETMSIAAYAGDVKINYLLSFHRSRLQFATKVGYASGDKSAYDKKLHLFNPLFPNLLYYQTAVGLFPSNMINPQVSVNWIRSPFRLLFTADAFWRATSGGLFAPFGIIPLPASGDRNLGYQLAFKGDCDINTNAELTVLLSRYFKSEFIERNPDRRGVDLLVNVLLNIKF